MNLPDLQQENGTLLMTRINGRYGRGNENDSTIKIDIKIIKPFLCDYSDAYVLVTGNVKVESVVTDTNVAFKNCAIFTRSAVHINVEHIETSNDLDIIMPMYNLTE